MADKKDESKPAEAAKAPKEPKKEPAKKDPSKPLEPKVQHIGGESIVDRLLPHMKKIIIAIIGVAVVLSAYYGWRSWREHQQEQQTDKLASVLGVGTRPLLPPNLPPDPNRPPGYTSEKERATAALAELAKQDAGDAIGHVYRGGLLLDAGKLDEAIAELRQAETADGINGALARESLGIALETKATAEKDPAARQKGLEGALQTFVAMQRDPLGPRYAYALYHQGRIQQTLGKKAEAKALYEKAKEIGGATELAGLIEQRLATLGAS